MQVEQIISTILTNGPSQGETSSSSEGDKEETREKVDGPLLPQLIAEFKILDRILEHWEDNEQQQSVSNGLLSSNNTERITRPQSLNNPEHTTGLTSCFSIVVDSELLNDTKLLQTNQLCVNCDMAPEFIFYMS